jgi:Mlc titration factor MtfA (ptsG expression regulator)
MPLQEVISLSIVFILLLVFLLFKNKKTISLPGNYQELLNDHVGFYRQLQPEEKARFEQKLKNFFSNVTIEGVHTNVSDLDKLLVASASVIPIMGLKNWKYYNLKTVLLYPETFNRQEFLQSGFEKDTLGMVGEGSMQQVMILSKPALHQGFRNEYSNSNTGIHEFVHLLDKEDGEMNGLPESLLEKNLVSKWNEVVSVNLELIAKGQSDINSYALTNRAEFFAVVSEYFFNDAANFRERHPDIFEMLVKIFHQNPLELFKT